MIRRWFQVILQTSKNKRLWTSDRLYEIENEGKVFNSILVFDWSISPSLYYCKQLVVLKLDIMNPNSVPSTIVTIQKFVTRKEVTSRFLSAFLDRLSKAKISIEAIDPTGKEINDVRQLSTRIMQQWNILFPNSPIHCIDTLSSNTLIATKTRFEYECPFTCREEVILDRTTQQKLKLMMEVEVLRSRLQQQQQESNRLQEEYSLSIDTE